MGKTKHISDIVIEELDTNFKAKIWLDGIYDKNIAISKTKKLKNVNVNIGYAKDGGVLIIEINGMPIDISS